MIKYEPGRTRGRLRLIEKSGVNWKCMCSCEREVFFSEQDLANVRSCGCIVILGLDLATNSGWAVRYSWRSAAAIKCGTFNVKENDSKETVSSETKYALVANQVHRLITDHKPDFVVIEEAEHRVTQFSKTKKNAVTGDVETSNTINPNALQLTGISGAAIGACMITGTPCGTMPARSWHSKFHGKGVRPAAGQDWKDIAIQSCERDGTPLPRLKADQKDAAEAACISGCWHWSKVLDISWMRSRFIALRINAAKSLQQRNERQVAA